MNDRLHNCAVSIENIAKSINFIIQQISAINRRLPTMEPYHCLIQIRLIIVESAISKILAFGRNSDKITTKMPDNAPKRSQN